MAASSSSAGKRGQQQRGGKKKAAASSLPADFVWPVVDPALPREPARFLKESAARSYDKVLQALLEVTPAEYHAILTEQLNETVVQASTVTAENSQRLYNFLSAHPNSKALPETWGPVGGSEFGGVGFRIDTGKRRVPDDMVYKQYESLQRNLPRGIVFLTRPGQAPELVLFGNRKFFGRQRGDDDDSDMCSSSLRSDFRHFLNSTKANGECCQVVWLPSVRHWVIGSKNRKIAVRNLDDIKHFENYLAAMGADRVRLLQDFLSVTKLTLNFEYESPAHQHIVFLDEERQVLIGCSGIHAPGKNLHPIFSYSIGRLFGFPSVLDNLTTYPRGELDAVCEEIASGWNTEGSVLVLLDENYLVLDLVKVKARWYVLLRAIREKIRRGVRDSVQRNQVVRAIDLRLHTLQRDMGMPEPFVNRFIALGARFADYLGKETTADPAEIIANYPVFWRRFLQAQQLPLGAELMAADSITYDATAFKKDDLPLLVFAQGIPGCGKSLVAVRTVEYLRSQGVSAVQLAQDDFAHLGQKQSGQACFDAVQTLLLEKQHRVVILARNNANKQQFGRYLQFDDYLCRTLFFCPAELSGDRLAEMVYMSVAAVLHRKQSDEPHPTDEMSEGSLAVLPLRFLAMLKIDRGAIRPEFLRPGPLPVPAVGLMNAQIKSAHANLKKMSDRDMAELRLDDAEHVKSVLTDFHRPADDVARDLGDALIRLLRYDVPPFGSYVCALLRPLSTEAALALIPPSVPASWTRHCHHMTLFHSSSFVARPDDWTNSLKQLGRDVQLRVAAVLADDRVCLAVVEPIDFDLTAVASGQPHITLATAPGVGPVASLDLLAAWAAGAAHVVVVPLPAEPLLLDSIVQLETQEAHDEVHDVDDSK